MAFTLVRSTVVCGLDITILWLRALWILMSRYQTWYPNRYNLHGWVRLPLHQCGYDMYLPCWVWLWVGYGMYLPCWVWCRFQSPALYKRRIWRLGRCRPEATGSSSTGPRGEGWWLPWNNLQAQPLFYVKWKPESLCSTDNSLVSPI